MHMFISVASLPATGYSDSAYKYWGCQALTIPSGDGVILRSEKYLFLFTCISSGCAWSQMTQQMDLSVSHPVLSYLPEGYTPTC